MLSKLKAVLGKLKERKSIKEQEELEGLVKTIGEGLVHAAAREQVHAHEYETYVLDKAAEAWTDVERIRNKMHQMLPDEDAQTVATLTLAVVTWLQFDRMMEALQYRIRQ